MRLKFADIRAGERRDAFGAFLVLFGLLAGHSMLETARDALFLAKIPATQLPIAYVAIAGLAILVSNARPRRTKSSGGRAALALALVGASAVTAAFWLLAPRGGDWVLYVLYVWSGLLATLLVVQFWILAGEMFTITQAKRVFAFVATGGILGAIAGSAFAQALAVRTEPVNLVLGSAGLFLATAVALSLLRDPPDAATSRETEAAADGLRATFEGIWSHPYLRRVACLVFLSSITFTIADFVFKSAIAREFSADQLGYVFATVYLILNVASLLMQLVVVGLLMRTLSVERVLAVTPTLLFGGAVWLAAGGATLAALAIKLVDGSFRHSLHRTASEVLYVPLSRARRELAKRFVDVVGQRGGQVVAAIAFLAVGTMGMAAPLWGVALAVLCVVWVVLAFELRTHYFDLFRSTLEEESVQTRIAFPDLDLGSLESLIAALGSPNDAEVIAALELLDEKQRTYLVPALVLYHPSPRVIVRALELFASAGRTDHYAFLARLLEHESEEVRVAALIATPTGSHDARRHERALQDASPDVRATALVGLVSSGDDVHPRARSILDTLVQAGSSGAKQALARAIARRPTGRFDDALESLAAAKDPVVAREAARAIRVQPEERFVPALVNMLPWRDAREEARLALVAIGESAFLHLCDALSDASLPSAVRRHVPRSLSRFEPVRACEILLARIPEERDTTIRYKLLRALGYVRSRHPTTRLEPTALTRAIEGSLHDIFQFTDWRARLETLSQPSDGRPARALTIELLQHKTDRAIENLFRLFSLQFPREDFRQIHRGFLSSNRAAWASSRELLEHLLRSPLKEAVLGALDDLPPARRVTFAGRYYRASSTEGRDALREILASKDDHLSCLAAHHVAELGIRSLGRELDELRTDAVGAMEMSFRNALERLSQPQPEGTLLASN